MFVGIAAGSANCFGHDDDVSVVAVAALSLHRTSPNSESSQFRCWVHRRLVYELWNHNQHKHHYETQEHVAVVAVVVVVVVVVAVAAVWRAVSGKIKFQSSHYTQTPGIPLGQPTTL